MPIAAQAYENGDHTCLIWLPSDFKPTKDCRGFAIQREKTDINGKKTTEFIRNFTGFADDAPRPKAGEEWRWPFQRFLWWDYDVKPGDKVRYSVIPVLGSNSQGTLKLDRANATDYTSQIEVTGQTSKNISAYFNKGIIATQWVSRELAAEAKAHSAKANATTLRSLITQEDDPLRNALSGLLRTQILQELNDAFDRGDTIYAALYELNDPELIHALARFGKRAHVILANGAFSKTKPDENAEARKALKALKTVEVCDRMVSAGHFAHNKFLVICDKTGQTAKTVVTGSTNWTVTGLCTQANNGLIIADPSVAAVFRQQWDLLKQAKNDFPASLKQANSRKKSFAVDGLNVTVWFVPTQKREDMDDARRVINGAKDGILFLFFNPGQEQEKAADWTLLQSILFRHKRAAGDLYNPDLYIRGVVNQTIKGLTDGDQPVEDGEKPPKHPVKLFTGGTEKPTAMSSDVLVPAAIKQKFHNWENELLSLGVMVHSKVVVVDPFGANPAVITGSHNLGVKASQKNDDNMVILEGRQARELAISYAVNIIAIFQEYRWRHYVATHRTDTNAFHCLQDDDQWQNGHLQNEQGEMRFWIGTPLVPPSPAMDIPAHILPSAGQRPGARPRAPQ
jgi:phosphatidylserine/phosphatidylglycerophosphate/cardiolipin synthase-like enzyme